MTAQISRRNVAKTTAWAVPVIAVGASAPASAASTSTVGAAVCSINYGTGNLSPAYQAQSINFQLSSSAGSIPAGAVITNQVCVDPSTSPDGVTWMLPTVSAPSANGLYTMTLTDSSGATLSSGATMSGSQCFNVVFTFQQATDVSAIGCTNSIAWDSATTMTPGATITVTQTSSVSGAMSAGVGSVSYKSARRAPNSVNTTGRLPTTFTSRSGTVTCFPLVTSTQMLPSDGADDVVCYPSGTNITTARCNWPTTGGKTCTASATGLCTPPYKGSVTGTTSIPAMC